MHLRQLKKVQDRLPSVLSFSVLAAGAVSPSPVFPAGIFVFSFQIVSENKIMLFTVHESCGAKQ